MLVRLKAQYTDQRGGTCYRGDRVSVPDDVGQRMLARGVAERLDRQPMPKRQEITETVKPILAPADLKGKAKRDWLRRQIVMKGGTPEGKTIAALEQELAAL